MSCLGGLDGGLFPVGRALETGTETLQPPVCLRVLRASVRDVLADDVEIAAQPVEVLEKLEYRGYDSAGVAVIEDGRVDSVRAVGHLGNLRAALEEHDETGGGRRRRGAPGDAPESPTPAGRPTAA